jgi:DNA-binding transcriptional LysR family regulator
LIGFEGASAIRRLIDSELEKAGVEVPVVMELRSIHSILRMVALRLGLAFVSRLGVEGAKDVKIIDVTRVRLTRSLAVVRRRGRPLSVAAQAFLESIGAARGPAAMGPLARAQPGPRVRFLPRRAASGILGPGRQECIS